MIIGEIMSKGPVCVKKDDYVTHARQLMRDHFLKGLPVVDDKNRVVGMLTDQDVLEVKSNKSNVTVGGFAREFPIVTPDTEMLKAASLLLEAEQYRVPVIASTTDKSLLGILSVIDILRHIHPTRKSPETVGEIMSQNVRTVNPDDSIAMVWENMLKWDYTGLPVVSLKKEVLGMVTRHDIIKSGFARIGDMHGNGSGDVSNVEKVMSTPLYYVSPQTSITKAIELILHYDVGRICVMDENKLVGIVGTNDLLKACIVGTGLE
jgi:CBS domain-containing protein